MRNLILIIKQFYSFFIFLILEIFCLIIVFKNNNYQQTSILNSSNRIAGTLYEKRDQILGFFALKKINDSLALENAKLKMKLGIAINANPLHDTSISKEVILDSTKNIVHYQYKPAKVINNTTDQKINYLTLNVGSFDGVKKNMAVVGDKGVVGKVANVSEHFCTVTSLLSERFNISAMTPDGTVGKIIWEGKNAYELLLAGIPQSVKLKAKDTIITSGYSSIFPEGIVIGYVMKSKSATTYQVYPASNFNNTHFVYIVMENQNEERIKLETETNNK